MAQWILEDPEHIVVRSEDEPMYDNTGRKISNGRRRLYAKFQRGGLPDYAVEVATSLWSFRKMPDGVIVRDFAGFYDSEADAIRMGWTDAEREEIEEYLDKFGAPRVGKPVPVAPWPKYDATKPGGRGVTWQTVAERHLETAENTGTEVAALLAYERLTRNQPELVAAYEARLAADAESEHDAVLASIPPLIEA